MGEFKEKNFRSALITGASSGIGEEFARQMASDCQQLILVARRKDRLEHLATDLKQSHADLSVVVYQVDLVCPEARESFIQDLANDGHAPDLLINNAGMGEHRELIDSDWAKLDQMMQLNMVALCHLTHALLPKMRSRGKLGGAIINVSSLASVLPIPGFGIYAASKAFVTSFSEALRLELKRDEIPVIALCPGPVHTEFGSVAMPDDAEQLPGRELFFVDRSTVVRDVLRGLRVNKARVFPGFRIYALAKFITMMPMWAVRMMASKRLSR